MPLDIATHLVQESANTVVASGSNWLVRVLHVEEGSLFAALHAGAPRRFSAPRRFRYIALTLEVTYRSTDPTELYPDTVVLVCSGSSPLQGLSQSPLLFFNEDTGEVHRLNEEPVAMPVETGATQHATFVYEFHHDCREFRLYFPGCEGIQIVLRPS